MSHVSCLMSHASSVVDDYWDGGRLLLLLDPIWQNCGLWVLWCIRYGESLKEKLTKKASCLHTHFYADCSDPCARPHLWQRGVSCCVVYHYQSGCQYLCTGNTGEHIGYPHTHRVCSLNAHSQWSWHLVASGAEPTVFYLACWVILVHALWGT